MTLFVRHPIRNKGKLNSYERQIGKYKENKKVKEEKTKKDKDK
ncbi:MAG: hypothetical protein WA091_01710 [Minisyncoccales bacterium]